jgi:hypothetical protein
MSLNDSVFNAYVTMIGENHERQIEIGWKEVVVAHLKAKLLK